MCSILRSFWDSLVPRPQLRPFDISSHGTPASGLHFSQDRSSVLSFMKKKNNKEPLVFPRIENGYLPKLMTRGGGMFYVLNRLAKSSLGAENGGAL